MTPLRTSIAICPGLDGKQGREIVGGYGRLGTATMRSSVMRSPPPSPDLNPDRAASRLPAGTRFHQATIGGQTG